MKVPAPPKGYIPPTLIERRENASEDMLLHNRRLGWMLRLAADHDLTLPPCYTFVHAAELIAHLLPDLFPDLATAGRYVGNADDADVAMGLLSADPALVTFDLPSGNQIEVWAVSDAATYVTTSQSTVI